MLHDIKQMGRNNNGKAKAFNIEGFDTSRQQNRQPAVFHSIIHRVNKV